MGIKKESAGKINVSTKDERERAGLSGLKKRY